MKSYEPILLRTAHRLFIASDKRLRPSGVMPPRLFTFEAAWGEAAALLPVPSPKELMPSNAAIARLSWRSSRFKSATILSKSKIRSLPRLSLDYWSHDFTGRLVSQLRPGWRCMRQVAQ